VKDFVRVCVFQAFLSVDTAAANFANNWETLCLSSFTLWEKDVGIIDVLATCFRKLRDVWKEIKMHLILFSAIAPLFR